MPQMLRIVSFTPSVHRLRKYQREPTIQLSVFDLEPVFDGPGATIHPLRRAFREPTIEIDLSDRDLVIGNTALVANPFRSSPPPVPRRAALRLAPPPPAFLNDEDAGYAGPNPVQNLALMGAQPCQELNVECATLQPSWSIHSCHVGAKIRTVVALCFAIALMLFSNARPTEQADVPRQRPAGLVAGVLGPSAPAGRSEAAANVRDSANRKPAPQASRAAGHRSAKPRAANSKAIKPERLAEDGPNQEAMHR